MSALSALQPTLTAPRPARMPRIAPMSLSRQRLWQIVKITLAVAIIAGVARHFAGILSRPELDPYPFALRLEYLVPAGLLYLSAHCSWAWFWVRLLRW